MIWLVITVVVVAGVASAALLIRLRAVSRLARQAREVADVQARRLGELEKLAARNKAILESAMDGFFVLGQDYRFLEVNNAFCRMTGYTSAELLTLKMTDLEVTTPAPTGRTDQWRTGLHHFATAHRHKDGHIIQLESCVIVLRDGDRKLLVGFARDVTERWEAEQALRKSEAQYRDLVETSRDLIWRLDLDGRWTFVNNASLSIFGYEPEEMLGRGLLEFAPPDHAGRLERFLAEVRHGKTRMRLETEQVRKDGRRIRLIVNAIPLRDDYGNVVGCTGTATDITERKVAERKLQDANARFRSLVHGMPLGYIVWSREGRVVEWNPAATAIFGHRTDDALGGRAADLILPESSVRQFDAMFAAALAGRASSGTTILCRNHAGAPLQCEWFNTILPDGEGGVHGIASLIRDVSERERLEAQLRQSQRLESLGVLAGGIAHDFNNLLVGIMGNASLAFEQLPPESPVRVLLDKVVGAGRRATHLTQRMLAYAGRAAFDVQLMDLNELVAELADFATAAIPKTVQLRIDTPEELPLIKADSGQMQQVIMNLLINAAEAIGERSGEVVVSTHLAELDAGRIAAEFSDASLTPGAFVCLEVRDTGCGMSPETLSRIFDPFFSTKFAGRGLGLSAMMGIVKAHKGAVTVQSRKGVGTTFRVYVPAATTQRSTPPIAPAPVALPRGSTVLVIDDEEDVRDVVEAVLASRGINVLTAEDGIEGLAVFQAHADTISAVLLDVNMPGMSGEQVFQELVKVQPSVKVILSTGYSEQEATSNFDGAALAGFVHKPYTATALVEKIGAALSAE